MKFVVAASIVLQVISIGIQTRPSNLLTCVRRPSWLLRIIVSMYIAVPLLATVLAKMSGVADRMKGAMLLMAIAAVAPLMPRKLLKIGVDAGFAESFAAVTMLLAIPLVPITATALGMMFGRTIVVPASAVAATLAKTFLVPLLVGMVLRAVLRDRSIRLGEIAGMAGTALLILVVLLLFIAQRETIFPLAWQSLPMLIVYAAGSLLIGHVIGLTRASGLRLRSPPLPATPVSASSLPPPWPRKLCLCLPSLSSSRVPRSWQSLTPSGGSMRSPDKRTRQFRLGRVPDDPAYRV